MLTAATNCHAYAIDSGRPACRDGVYREPSPGTCAACAKRRPVHDGPAVQQVRVVASDRMATEGPRLWDELHRRPWRAGDQERAWLASFAGRVPCGECRSHFNAWRQGLADDVFADPDAYFAATWALHESVNRRLGKRGPTLIAARAMYVA